jgi:lysophospholipase L1-like esterase
MTRAVQRTAFASALILLLGVVKVSPQQSPATGRWVTAWSTSQQGLAANGLTNTTVRMIARVTASGEVVRIRLDNTFGEQPLVIGKAFVGLRIQGAALAEGSNQPVTFGGSPGVTIAAGGTVTSDSVRLKVLAQQDVAVSVHLPGASVRPSQHTAAHVTSYLAADGAGDVTAPETATAFTMTTTSMYWLKAIDVSSSSSTGGVVMFGDSITDGTCSTVDAHDRWEDLLALRLSIDARRRGKVDAHKAILNEGIGGNTITREVKPPPDSPPGRERFERDVLSHHGVTHVVLFMGTNDIRREAGAAQVIAGMQDLAMRVKARGLKAIGVTIIPRHNRAPVENNSGWDAAKTRVRNEVNQWIRSKAPFDAVIDFDKIVQDSRNADVLLPSFNCGDGIHPSPRGYFEMGQSVRLELFD